MTLAADSTAVRLAYLLSCYPKRSEAFVHREIQALRRRGVALHVASINDPDVAPSELPEDERHACVDTLYIKAQGVRRALSGVLAEVVRRPVRVARTLGFAAGGARDLRGLLFAPLYVIEAILVGSWLRAAHIDHLHVHFGSAAATVGLFVQHLFDVTFSMTIHGPDELYDVERHRLAEKVEAATFVCCISSYARSQLMRLVPSDHWNKIEVNPLGVDAQRFAPRPRLVTSGPVEILCVGRLVPAKGQHLLVDAVAALRAAGRNVRLTLVGEGPDRASLQQTVSALGLDAIVTFTGGIGQDRIRDLYASADIFALPSFAEGVPVVLMEAMAMAIPCVSTRITGIPELIHDGIDGLLVAPSDVGELVGALARLCDDVRLRHRLGAAGRRQVLRAYELERNVDGLLQTLRRHLADPLPPEEPTQLECAA